jgi:hypothetical protein
MLSCHRGIGPPAVPSSTTDVPVRSRLGALGVKAAAARAGTRPASTSSCCIKLLR